MRSADYAMGSIVTFDVRPGPCTPGNAGRALRRARALLHRADELFGGWRPDSPVNRLHRGEITLAQAPPEVAEILWRCADARRVTAGWFDPWAGPGGVDPSGIVRGWAVAEALELLRRAGVRAARVDAGPVTAAFGTPEPDRPWRIAAAGGWTVGPPSGVERALSAVASAAGGDGEPRWASVAVAGPDPALAEALAAAVVAAGPDVGLAVVDRVPGFDALAVADDGQVRATPALARRLSGGARGTARGTAGEVRRQRRSSAA